MANVLVNATVTLDSQQLLEGLTQLDTPELEKVYERVCLILEHRKNSAVSSVALPAMEAQATENSDTENSAVESDIPIVENLIPTSITLDGSRISL